MDLTERSRIELAAARDLAERSGESVNRCYAAVKRIGADRIIASFTPNAGDRS